jgi:hypothetical protein
MSDPAGVLQPGGLSGALAGRAGVEVVLANWGGVRARPQTFDLPASMRRAFNTSVAYGLLRAKLPVWSAAREAPRCLARCWAAPPRSCWTGPVFVNQSQATVTCCRTSR